MVNLIKLLALASLSYVVWFIIRDLLKPSIGRPGGTGSPGNGPAEAPKSKDVQDALSLFGLDGEPSWKDVKKAYTSTVQLYHPDKVAGMGPELQEVAESKMKALNAAYSLLQRHYGVKG
ncbi:MAG: DnaJ domain-containing protein [Myxococcota bacterium]|nr:DnaJ domain-containing protein [Myxococcota bacterium]